MQFVLFYFKDKKSYLWNCGNHLCDFHGKIKESWEAAALKEPLFLASHQSCPSQVATSKVI